MTKIIGGAAQKVVMAGPYDDGSGDYAPLEVVLVRPLGRGVLIDDEALNDSDKTLIVPDGYQYHVLSVFVELTSTAAAGDRQIIVEAQDTSGDVIGQVRAGAVQAASLTYYYQFSPSCADLTAVRDTTFLMTPLPLWVLPAGYQLRIADSKAIAAAADDMIVQVVVLREATV